MPAPRTAIPLLVALLGLLPLLGPPRVAAADTGLRVAVLEFTNASTDPKYDPLGKGLQSMLTTDLSAVASLQLVERSRLSEIQGEIELGQSGAVDAATAVRVGKLAGASHLLAGSFSIVGDVMRLDARLFAVEDGSVRFGEQIQGETEAFFELEKELVDAVIGSFGLQLAARERAAVSRIHTADFEAFASFSAGIDLFDREAYDDALERLRDATARDEDFKLARITLAEYEDLIASLRTRRDELASARAELERLEKMQRVQGEALVVQKLFGLAAARGTEARRQRLTALYLLTVAYANLGTNRGKLGDLRRAEDAWAMQRTADVLAASYYSEAVPLWPAIPIVIDDDFYRGLPTTDDFDDGFVEATEYLWSRGADHPENRRNYLMDSARYPRRMARMLHLDRAEEVRLREQLIDLARQLGPHDYWRKEQKEALVEDFRAVLRLDESTALVTSDAAGEDNPHVLEGVAREVEHNRDYEALLAGTKNPERMAEWILLAQDADWSRGPIVRQGTDHFGGGEPDDEGIELLNRMRARGIGDDEYILIGDSPIWALQGDWWLKTGPRTDPLRADELRYFKEDQSRSPMDALTIVDGVPRESVEARFELGVDPPSDWYDRKWTSEHAGVRPAFGFLFGLQDLRVDKLKDPETDEYVLNRPTTGYAVWFVGDRVELVRLVETKRGSYDRKEEFGHEVLDSAPVKWPRGGSSKVSIKVDGSTVKVAVDGRTSTLKGVEPREGFYGFRFGGPGYLSLGRLRIEAR